MEKIKIYIKVWDFKIERIDNNDFYLKVSGATKDGQGKRYEIYLKMPFSFVGYLRKNLKIAVPKQIERLKGFIGENEPI